MKSDKMDKRDNGILGRHQWERDKKLIIRNKMDNGLGPAQVLGRVTIAFPYGIPLGHEFAQGREHMAGKGIKRDGKWINKG